MANIVLTKVQENTQGTVNEGVTRALDTLKYFDLNGGVDMVVIKPNLCYYWDYSTGETTDPRVVSAVIDWVRQRIGRDVNIVVAEADASAMRTKYAFRMLGYEKMSSIKDVQLVNLSEGEVVDKEVLVAGEKIILPVNRLLLETDLIINVPKIKFHRSLGFTCALKNMFGAIAKPRKYDYHSKLARVIVGINKIVKSDIVLVDGVIAGGKVPKKIGAIVVGDDALATDITVARALNNDPSKIEYLKLAIKEGIGDGSCINITENPLRLEDIQRKFYKQHYMLTRFTWQLQLKLLRTYARIVNDVIPPVLQG